MEIQNDILDYDDFEDDENLKDVEVVMGIEQFIALSIMTMGLYQIWWAYKSWRFFQQKRYLDVAPALRALFGFIYLISLFKRILEYAKEKGYQRTYSSEALFVLIIISNIIVRLPAPYWLLSNLSFICLIPPFQALNFAKENSEEFTVVQQLSFNSRQTILIFAGFFMWIFVLSGIKI